MDRLLVTNKEESAFLNAKRSQGQLETPQPLSVPTYTYIYLLIQQSTYLPTYLPTHLPRIRAIISYTAYKN